MFGFGIEALGAQNGNAGKLIVTDTKSTQLMDAKVGGVTRTNLVHKSNGGSGTNEYTIKFDWTAPKNEPTVTFYVVGNAVNRDGTTGGDYIYKTTKTLTQIDVPSTVFESQTATVSAYPNPATDFVSLKLPNGTANYVIYVYNASGQLVSTELTPEFNISSLPDGIYSVVISSINNKLLAQSRFVKQ
jgi:hypothetical protein